ncbi:reverse transcriptase family protein [Myxococcota bacterium]|nr:reverse transcriptase family protein [Myxococcota bacterium]
MGILDFLKNLLGGGQPTPTRGGSAEPDLSGGTGTSRPVDGAPSGVADAAQAHARKKKGGPRSWAPPDILGLSADELRKRALKIRPWATPWIGRTDVIPPESDERTALIDRGLVLHGKLTRAELDEIHEVGDLWLKHHRAVELAAETGRAAGEAAVEALRADRRARRQAKKAEAAEKLRLRTEAIAERRRTDIIYLGRGLSSGLSDRRSNIEKLQALGLPILSTPADVAALLGISVPRLRWLAFHAEAAERTHYVYFEIPKRSGGTRTLAAPHAQLLAAQRKILVELLEKLDPGEHAHGFVKGRSTVTNARPHVGSHDVVNLDVQDFFPTINVRRVRGLFKKLGYSPAVATVLALLVTEAPRVPMEYEGKRWWVAIGERCLPQGAPTSPAISNLVCRRLDKRLAGLARSAGWRYTRYADDLTFSADPGKQNRIPWLMRQVSEILAAEGFTAHPRKRRVQKSGARQEVTGIVVNSKLGVPRDEVRRLRAILHGAKRTGLAAQNREGRPNFEAWLRGKIAYVMMVDRAKGQKLLAELDALGPTR